MSISAAHRSRAGDESAEFVDATIDWAGGYESRHEPVRPVATYAQLRDFEPLMNRVVKPREKGHTAASD